MLLAVELMLAITPVARLSDSCDLFRDTSTHLVRGDTANKCPASKPQSEVEQVQNADKAEHGASAHSIQHPQTSNDDYSSRLEISAESATVAFCKFVKNTVSGPEGALFVAEALWKLSHDENRFAKFRAWRIENYDEELEAAVVRSAEQHLSRWIFSKHRSFEFEYDDSGNIYFDTDAKFGGVHFNTPSLRSLADFRSLSLCLGLYTKNERVCHLWHVLCIVFPALRKLCLQKGMRYGINAWDIKDIGSCVGVEVLKMDYYIKTGDLVLLKNSKVSRSIDTLVLRGQTLQDADIDAIGSFSMRILIFYYTAENARSYTLAKILENEAIAACLEGLHIVLTGDTSISAWEASAIAGLRNVRSLTLRAEASNCGERVAGILKDTPISIGLRGLTLDLPDISPSDIDIIANLSLVSLSLSCRNVTSRHLSRIAAGPAGVSITHLELENTDVNTIFGDLAALKNLRSLRLSRYTASAWPIPSLAQFDACARNLKRLELVNEKLFCLLESFIAAKSDLEELVLAVDNLGESELSSLLRGKEKLRTLEIVGGSVMGYGVGMIAGLRALTSLSIKDAAMSYEDLVMLVDGTDLRRRLQKKLKLRVKVVPFDKRKITALYGYGFEYVDGVVFN